MSDVTLAYWLGAIWLFVFMLLQNRLGGALKVHWVWIILAAVIWPIAMPVYLIASALETYRLYRLRKQLEKKP